MERSDAQSARKPEAPIKAIGDHPLPNREHFGYKTRVLDRWLLERLLASLGNPPIEMALWDGQKIAPADKKPLTRLVFRDRGALLRLISDPELQFGETYSAGRTEVEGDLVTFLESVYRAWVDGKRAEGVKGYLARSYKPVAANTLSNARENIHSHYDIGNDFYRLWLDRQMVYTCAYFPTPDVSLEAAQVAKFDHVCRKLWLKPGETVIEAGCGWGALALHMAKHYGVNVKAYNISREQLSYARERVRREGLENRVEFVEGDYREIKGKFDVFVSVGMLEHVGIRQYRELGKVMASCLTEDGRGLVHSIGRDRPAPLNKWIVKHIFPGAQPPSISEMSELFEPWGFSLLDMENLRLHYAKTLEHWLSRYEDAAEEIGGMFDPTFVRTWRLYLAGSLAAFRTGTMQLFQIVFTRTGCNRVPWTREHLYSADGHL